MKKSINKKEQCVKTDVMQSVLKASDLRIGNLIAFGKQCCKVYEIQENCFYVIGEKERSFKNTSFELEPIKLNEEWLIKLGLKKIEEYFFELDDIHVNTKRELIWITTKCKRELEFNIPNYIHELQNLYFALTGSELTVA